MVGCLDPQLLQLHLAVGYLDLLLPGVYLEQRVTLLKVLEDFLEVQHQVQQVQMEECLVTLRLQLLNLVDCLVRVMYNKQVLQPIIVALDHRTTLLVDLLVEQVALVEVLLIFQLFCRLSIKITVTRQQ